MGHRLIGGGTCLFNVNLTIPVGRLKELRMGVQVTEETIEDVQVDPEWFENI
jgi:hypothetical protein